MWNQPYLSSSDCQSPNGDSPRRFPEALKKCNLEFLDPGHLLGQTLVGDVLKVTSEYGEVDSTNSEKITHQSLEGDRRRVVTRNAHHFTKPFKLRR